MIARTNISGRLAAQLLAVLMLLVAAPAASAVTQTDSESVGFAVSPLRFDVIVAASATTTHPITITNTDDTAVVFTFSKEDFQGDKDDPGATPVLMGGKFASAISGFDWIEAPASVTIPGGQSRTVSVKVTPPSGSTGGHYAALVVEGAARGVDSVVASSRMGVLFLMNAGGVPPPEIVITEITEVGPTTTVTEFINNGSTDTTPTGTITKDPVGPGTKRIIKGVCSTALPGGSGRCTFVDEQGNTVANGGGYLPGGPVERYVDIVGDAGEGEGTSARGELPTEWAGAWTSLLLPLVGIALFVLYFLFLRRRRKSREGVDDLDLAWS